MQYQISNFKDQKSTSENKNKTEIFKTRLYTFVLNLIKFVEELSTNKVNRVLGDQLLRSGTSVLANFVEAKSSSSRKDYTNFFTYSLKSANESVIWLQLLRDTRHANEERVELLIKELEEISKIFASSILTLKGKRNTFDTHI